MTAETNSTETIHSSPVEAQDISDVDLVAKFKESGLTQREFSRQYEVSNWRLRKLLYAGRYKKNSARKKDEVSKSGLRSNFIPLEIINGNGIQHGVVELHLREGRILRFHEGLSVEILQRLISAVESSK